MRDYCHKQKEGRKEERKEGWNESGRWSNGGVVCFIVAGAGTGTGRKQTRK